MGMQACEYKRVVDAIPYGRKNAVSRVTLAANVGMTDRQVRKCIEAARKDGRFIISANENGGGYYIATDLEEIEAQYKIDRARALAVLSRLKPMRQKLKTEGRL